MVRLKLIDADLLMRIINNAKPTVPTNQNLQLSASSADNLNQILNDKPSDINASTYNAELQNYSNYLKKYNDEQPQQQQRPPAEIQDNEAELGEIVKRAGPRLRPRMLTILDRLKSPDSQLKWNSSYQLVENGKPIQGTNLFDLLKTVTGERKIIPPTPGLQTFAHHLSKLNVPQQSAATENMKRILATGNVPAKYDPLVQQQLSQQPAWSSVVNVRKGKRKEAESELSPERSRKRRQSSDDSPNVINRRRRRVTKSLDRGYSRPLLAWE